MTPPPARVQGNRWDKLERPELGAWKPTSPVTVVMPYFQARPAVEITLAALGEQTYPLHLLEVVIADDGSDPPLTNPKKPEGLDVRVIYQEDRGFGAPRARNAGVRAAGGEIIVFADCDMVPEPAWVEAHARWHHLASDVLSLGFRRHVSFEGITPELVAAAAARGRLAPLFEGRTIERPEWIEYHMTRTSELTSTDDDLFRIVTTGNMSVRKDWFVELGGFDESFTQWGAEDTEFGYRAFARGSVLAPDREALAWHQGLGTTPDESETVSLEQQRAKIAHLIAQRGFRRSVPGRSFTVPYVVVTVDVEDTSAATVTETVERVLGNRFHDLVVELDVPPAHPHHEWIRRQFEPDPRVSVSSGAHPTERWPATARFIAMPPAAQVRDYAIDHLVDLSGDAGVTHVPLADGSEVRVVWGRALQRARRLGGGSDLAEELFGGTELDWRDVGVRSPGSGPGAATRGLAGRLRRVLNSPDSRAGKVWRQARSVRSPADAARVIRWFAGAVKQKLASRSLTALPPVPKLSSGSGVSPRPAPTSDAALGACIAVAGDRASAVLGASSRPVRVTTTLRAAIDQGGHVDVVVVSDDTPQGPVESEAAELGLPVVRIGGESGGLPPVPAIDPQRVNPVGWVYHAGDRVMASPTVARLTAPPPENALVVAETMVEVPPGVSAKRVASLADETRLARYVVDRADFHADPLERAARLVELSASGVPVVADDLGPAMVELLGGELSTALSRPPPGDLVERERHSVAARRAALRDHSLAARARALLAAGALAPLRLPPVSVVLATNRPVHLAGVLDMLDGQTYPELEMVVVLHGDRFAPQDTGLMSDRQRPLVVRRADTSLTLGEALNLGVDSVSGELIAKVDDDDLYGPDHIWDLVLAHGYSGAELVGKGAEFVYLAGHDVTIRRFVARSETYTTTIGGGALLIGRADLRAVGGWRRVPARVDRALVADVERAGARIYRTHGLGYVLNRHGVGHTWVEGDQYFLDQAEDQRPGLDRTFAGLD